MTDNTGQIQPSSNGNSGWGKPFQPGQSGNPKGRPRGSKNKLSELLVSTIVKDFEEHGADAITKLREKDPKAYLALIVKLIPREILIARENAPAIDYADLTDEEVAELLIRESQRQKIESYLETARKR